jgi:hypothetical protein
VNKSHQFSEPVLGQRTSPFLQEKLVELGSEEVYGKVSERVKRLLGIDVSQSQVYRSCQRVAENIVESDTYKPTEEIATKCCETTEMVYGMVDGSMLQLDGGWQETKVGRVFQAKQLSEKEDFKWEMGESIYVAKRGHYQSFTSRFEELLPPESSCQKVFVTDAAPWICNWISDAYQKNTVHILDFFHVCEKLAEVKPKNEGEWFEKQKGLLLESKVPDVISELEELSKIGYSVAEKLIPYFKNHKDKMDYKLYRSKGWMIGSGPIESAHRTVLQVRMKRSGQRWAEVGCDNLIKLRLVYKNSRSKLVKQALKNVS